MAQADRPSIAIGYRDLLLRHPNYRLLWSGHIVSLLGDWFNLIATASLIALLTGSGMAIGSLFAIRMLAPFLTSPLAGVIADRWDRRRILIACDLLRAVVVACFLLVREPEHVWLLYVLTAIQLSISGASFTARRAILPDLIPSNAVGAANALSSATWSVMLAFGAASGGVVAGIWGIYPAFAIDAVTFLISAIIISRLRPRPREGGDHEEPSSFFGEYVRGLRYLRQTPDVLVVVLQKACIGLVASAGFEVVQVAIASDVLGAGEGGGTSLGLLYACSGIGSGLGPVIGRCFTGDRDRALRRAIGFGYLLASFGLLTISTLHGLGAILVGTVLRSAGSGVVWVFTTQLILANVPAKVRGRAFSAEQAAFSLVAAIAAGGIGGLLDSVPDLGHLIRWMALVNIVPAALWMLCHMKRKDLRTERGT